MVSLKIGRYYDLDGDLLLLSDLRKLEEHRAVRIEAIDMVSVTQVNQQSRYWQQVQNHTIGIFDFELLAGSRCPPLSSWRPGMTATGSGSLARSPASAQLIILRRTIPSLQYLKEVQDKDLLLYIRKAYKSQTFIDILKGVKP